MAEQFANFSEFYPFYLSEHQNPVSRRLHVIGSLLTLLTLSHILRRQLWRRLIVLPLIGYGFAWVGHFFFEHNKPATFSHPWYSLMGDWVMIKDVLTRKVAF